MNKIVILFLDQDSSMYLHLTLMDLHSECKICCSKIQHNKNHSIERCINAMIKKYVPFKQVEITFFADFSKHLLKFEILWKCMGCNGFGGVWHAL